MSDRIEGKLLGGRYRIGPVLGRGGMSVVRKAEDLVLSRQVAIKLIRGAQSRELSERLFREGRAAARANHPAVVTIFESGSDDETGFDYLVMEFLEGEDVGARLARERCIPLAQTVSIGVEVADALMQVHAAGVVHRDLKPANIFLARRGLRVDEVKLLDFGVAKQADQETITLTGQSIGTTAYMAPEQLRAAKQVDPRSDLYALGVVLFECVTGALPYASRRVEDLVRRVLDETDVQLHDGVPRALRPILERCLRRRPDDRFADAAALRDALLRCDLAR